MFARPHDPFRPGGNPGTDVRAQILERVSESHPSAEMIAMLGRDHTRMREAGTKLAEAALYVIREHDGCHRLALAVAEWAQAIADEGDRGTRHAPIAEARRRAAASPAEGDRHG